MQENPKLSPRAKDQVLGCMVGGAVGDALGYAVEFEEYRTIVKKYGEKGITRFQLDRHGLAEISDDTQMSLFTAAGILLGMTRGYMRGIMGALLGRSAIPAHFTDQLELRDIIEEIATDLFTGCIISEYDERNTPEKMRWFDKYCCQRWEPRK